jgi:hypothetical protein
MNFSSFDRTLTITKCSQNSEIGPQYWARWIQSNNFEVSVLTCIVVVPSSNISRESNYSNWGFSCFSSITFVRSRDSTLNLATITLFRIHYSQIILYLQFLTAPLNVPQTKKEVYEEFCPSPRNRVTFRNVFVFRKFWGSGHLLVSCLAYLSVWRWRWHIPSKRQLTFKRTTRHYIPEDRNLQVSFFFHGEWFLTPNLNSENRLFSAVCYLPHLEAVKYTSTPCHGHLIWAVNSLRTKHSYDNSSGTVILFENIKDILSKTWSRKL